MNPLGTILHSLGIQYNFYADDSQIISLSNLIKTEFEIAKTENAIEIITVWMAKNFLCHSNDKTEVLIISSKYAQQKLNIPHISIGNDTLVPSSQLKNI